MLPEPSTDVSWLYGMHDGPAWASLFDAIETFQYRIPSWYFPIGYDSGGNQFIMSLYSENYGIIAFWDHENEAPEGEADQYFENLRFVAESFTEFLNMLSDR